MPGKFSHLSCRTRSFQLCQEGNGNKCLDELLTERSRMRVWKLRLTAVNEDKHKNGEKGSPVPLPASGTVCLGNSHEGQTEQCSCTAECVNRTNNTGVYAAFTVLFCLLQRKYITYYKYYLYYTINHNDMRLWLLTLSNLAHKTS